MLTYAYRAKNDEGMVVTGGMLGDRREAVIAVLKKKGYYVLKVEPQGRVAGVVNATAGIGHHVRVRDRAVFTHQLATLLKAGVQLSVALKTVANQTQNKYLASVVRQLHDDIVQSSSLSEAMATHPRVFSRVYTAIVAAAEESGALAETLAVLSRQLKSQTSVNARIRGAMVYPVFLLFVSAIVVGVLTTFVIPKFVQLFVNSSQKLPLPTKILVASTDLLRGSWWMFVLAIIGLTCLVVMALRQERIRLWFDGLMLRLPLVGQLNQKLQLAHFSRTFGSLLNGGVRIVTAVNTTRGTTANRAFSREIERIGDAILKGAPLARAISQQRYFTEIAVNMIAVGEDSGTLPEMLLEVADMYDQECESAISSVTSLLGPVMIVLLGLLVGFVVMAILLPIFEASTLVR